MSKSWQEKFETRKESKIKILEKNFTDIKAGQKMLISTPSEITKLIKTIPAGYTLSLKELRLKLAKAHKADNTCPVTTGIFLRIISERSLELMVEGMNPLAPFWRAVDPESPLAQKMSCGPDFIADLRSKEVTKA